MRFFFIFFEKIYNFFEFASTAVRLTFDSGSTPLRDRFGTGSGAVRLAFCRASAASEQVSKNYRRTAGELAKLVRAWYEFGTLTAGKNPAKTDRIFSF